MWERPQRRDCEGEIPLNTLKEAKEAKAGKKAAVIRRFGCYGLISERLRRFG